LGLPSNTPLPVKAQLATSAWLKPDSNASPAMPVTLASEPLPAWGVTSSLPGSDTALAIMPPTG